MELYFNFQVKDLDGNEISGDTNNIGKALGKALSQQDKGDSNKVMEWATKLWRHEVLEIDGTDLEIFCALVESSDKLYILTKSQVQLYIKKVKEKGE